MYYRNISFYIRINKYITFYIQHLYVNQQMNGLEMFLMEDDLESFVYMENEKIKDLNKIDPTIGFVLKKKYNLIYNNYMYLKKIVD